MENTKFQLDKARRYYDDDEEEEAIVIIDEMIGIKGMSFEAALDRLKQWQTKSYTRPEIEFRKLPDDSVLATQSNGFDGPLTDMGIIGLYDVLNLRSRALSAIMFGKNKDKNKHFPISVDNARIIMGLFENIENEHEAILWCLASQPTLLAGDPELVKMGVAMHFFALEACPNLAKENFYTTVVAGCMSDAVKRNQGEVELVSYWEKILGILNSINELDATTKKPTNGWFANLLKKFRQ